MSRRLMLLAFKAETLKTVGEAVSFPYKRGSFKQKAVEARCFGGFFIKI
jgi:hypothetical protein